MRSDKQSGFHSKSSLAFMYRQIVEKLNDETAHVNLRNKNLAIYFSFNFNTYKEVHCLVNFQLTKKDIYRLLPVLDWKSKRPTPKENFMELVKF